MLCATRSRVAEGAGLERDQALRWPPSQGSEQERRGLGRASESISEPEFGTGSRSARIVLRTPGNAARADPAEGRGAPLLQTCSWETRRVL
jgi:hypothetical protein